MAVKNKSKDKRSKFSSEERAEHVRQLEVSGESQKVYCTRTGISQVTLSRWIVKARKLKGKQLGKKKHRKPGPNTPEQRRQAVEAYQKSGITQKEFSKVWGVSPITLRTWLRLYDSQGPKGLEGATLGRVGKKRGAKGLPEPVKKQIEIVKRENPGFGFRKVRDFLWRFKAVDVSAGSVKKIVDEAGLPRGRKIKRKPRRRKQVRRFERAKPMQLWQSDITSFVLPRHGQRVYLLVFMDDCSRYVVSWGLHLRQTGEVVIEALLDGIQRFGKPQEVLTDQGRQYFSWRGKCDFQKLLLKQGIQHVVARSHHPQTVGKCERFWETVGEEFWDRIKPQELAEARERLKHFIAHYNHFRPHQGIDGMVPADRFFGLESEIRKAIEATLKQNELRIAIGENPRSPVFLIGQIGDQPVSLHGEDGRLIFQTSDGETKTLEYEKMGHLAEGDKNDGPNNTGTDSSSNPGSSSCKTNEAIPEEVTQINTTPDSTHQGPLGECLTGTAGESPKNRCAPDGILDGTHNQEGPGITVEPVATENLAAVPASNFGYDGGAAGPAEVAKERGNVEPGRESQITSQENCESGAHDNDSGTLDRSSAGNAGDKTSEANCAQTTDASAEGSEGCQQENSTPRSSS